MAFTCSRGLLVQGGFYGRVWHNVRLTISGKFEVSVERHETNPNQFTGFPIRQDDCAAVLI